MGKVAKWSGDQPTNFTCDLEGRLAEPLPNFFAEWVAHCPKSDTTGKTLLPQDLLMEGKLPTQRDVCFYKGCKKSGHRWDHCPKLAMHVAKNPAVRDY